MSNPPRRVGFADQHGQPQQQYQQLPAAVPYYPFPAAPTQYQQYYQRPEGPEDDYIDSENEDTTSIATFAQSAELVPPPRRTRFHDDDGYPQNPTDVERSNSGRSLGSDGLRRGFTSLNRRKKTIKLSSAGNFVIKHRVPDQLLPEDAPYKTGEEFETMRYTAATADPDDFVKRGYSLRIQLYRRPIELMVVVTMYNEDQHLFARTMFGLAQNIKHLSEVNNWGWDPETAWQKVAVIIVSDGRGKANPNVLKVLEAMGVYQDGLAQAAINGEPVTAHIYEYTAQSHMDEKHRFWGGKEGFFPMQLIFCLKEKNAKKINSHRWFLNAFAPLVNPRVVCLIDVGTKPDKAALYHLWDAFFRNPQIAGACGEIRADLGTGLKQAKNLLNPIVASQNFEYKISNLMDKALESVFGYIAVLPGAFSAYRYEALLDVGPGEGPLSKYFEGEQRTGPEARQQKSNVFNANLYLAEDRILCFELVTKSNARWLLHYVKDAYAATDVPDTVPEFLSQRRRWLNGSMFAGFYAIANIGRMWGSQHRILRKLAFTVQWVYSVVSQLFSWFVLGNFAVTFYFLFQELKTILQATTTGTDSNIRNKIINVIIDIAYYLYPVSLVCLFVISFGNRPQAFRKVYVGVMAGFSLIGAIMLGLIVRRLTIVASNSFNGGAKPYTDILNMYVTANKTMTLSKLPSGPDQAQFVIAQMMSLAAEVLENEMTDMIEQSNQMSLVYLVTLCATIGAYFAASFLQMDFMHMFTSFLQYMLMLPSYVNVLTVYALSNIHDVSWGTKGDSKAEALPVVAAVKQKDGTVVADVNLGINRADLSQRFKEIMQDLNRGPAAFAAEKTVAAVDLAQKQEDDYKAFRTWLMLIYLATNFLLYILATSISTEAYITGLLWIVAGLSGVKLIGVVVFVATRLVAEKTGWFSVGRKEYVRTQSMRRDDMGESQGMNKDDSWKPGPGASPGGGGSFYVHSPERGEGMRRMDSAASVHTNTQLGEPGGFGVVQGQAPPGWLLRPPQEREEVSRASWMTTATVTGDR